ncbi:polymer-forming cytoskeletal protein [Cupriavidus sp. AU9028]|uniref:bactofilin family protein n=1 Tax=Cupriavidus sp. AU9028 TaxID=2871157 RepID=UPI001C9595AE|nr:polymer-forming cytoskeletal protein [Cupriavidus sp. AU9028]MBY4898929.1 polymer-forming cytoskeletal protein [Cupriavidus sp. AU9028]
MLFSKKKGLTIDTLLGEHTVVEGDLTFTGGLRLDGRVRGNVIAPADQSSMLVISEKGVVEGEVRVGHLVLNGTVTGPVHASELLELQPKARVQGEVHYAALEMHQGALVEGRLIPLGNSEPKALPNLTNAPAAEEESA